MAFYSCRCVRRHSDHPMNMQYIRWMFVNLCETTKSSTCQAINKSPIFALENQNKIHKQNYGRKHTQRENFIEQQVRIPLNQHNLKYIILNVFVLVHCSPLFLCKWMYFCIKNIVDYSLTSIRSNITNKHAEKMRFSDVSFLFIRFIYQMICSWISYSMCLSMVVVSFFLFSMKWPHFYRIKYNFI